MSTKPTPDVAAERRGEDSGKSEHELHGAGYMRPANEPPEEHGPGWMRPKHERKVERGEPHLKP